MRQPLFLHYWLMVSDINSVQEKFQTQQFNFSILQGSVYYPTQFISLISESVERLYFEFFFEFSDRWYNRLRIILWLNSSWWVANRFFHWFPFGCRSRREKWWFFNRKPMIRWWYFTLKGPNQLYQTATLVRTVTTSFLSIIIYGTKIFFFVSWTYFCNSSQFFFMCMYTVNIYRYKTTGASATSSVILYTSKCISPCLEIL